MEKHCGVVPLGFREAHLFKLIVPVPLFGAKTWSPSGKMLVRAGARGFQSLIIDRLIQQCAAAVGRAGLNKDRNMSLAGKSVTGPKLVIVLGVPLSIRVY
jgi:hypothetical protein